MFVAGMGLGALGGAGSTLLAKHDRVTIAPTAAMARTLAALSARARPARDPHAREPLGTFQLTYYWMAAENAPVSSPSAATAASGVEGPTPEASATAAGDEAILATATEPPGGAPAIQLYDKRCGPVARVSESFARRLRLEGAGKLASGRVITISGACKCPYSPCYHLASRRHRFGIGVHQRPLLPFRSVAVDPKVVAIGTPLYIPELDGVTMPGRAPYGGFVHDGCVVADDEGGGIRGKQIDFFTARKTHYFALLRRLHLKKVTVYDGRDRCRGAPTRKAPSRGSI